VLFLGLAAMFVLIGVAVLYRILFVGPPSSGFPLHGLWGLFLLLIVIWLVMWIVRGAFWMVRGPPRWYRGRWSGHDSAVGIARERYARGELTREQYEQLRRDLG
jgi:putative membrane protein